MKATIAVAQYAIGRPADFAEFAARIEAGVAGTAAAGAAIIVLPEYLALEAAAMFADDVRSDFARSLAALQDLHAGYLALARGLAVRHRVHLVAGTFLLDNGSGHYRNRAVLASPSGQLGWQDKLCLTGFERASGLVEAGDVLKVFDTAFGRIAVCICYDIEFPLYARAATEAGVRLILVPSCTDTAAGANRVRIGCQARAMENGVYVACAVTAGEAAWSPALDTNTGTAAIYTPLDRGWPDDGVLARASGDWAIAEIDFAALDARATAAQVGIRADWPRQSRPGVCRAVVERL